MDPSKRRLVSDTVIPALINSVQAGLAAHVTADDVGLIWLSDQSQTAAAVSALNANQTAAGINEILALEGIKLIFNDPVLDSRTPDIIVLPDMGVIYAGANSTAIAEHGGLKGQDTNVPILISNPVITQTTIKTPVQTMQIAPTILRVLGLNPAVLQGAALEHTRVLPGLGLEKDEGKIVY
jgi:arylsulfatase A-like enzyme